MRGAILLGVVAAATVVGSCKSPARQRAEAMRDREELARRMEEEQARFAAQARAEAGAEPATEAEADADAAASTGPRRLVDVSVGERHACGRTAEGDVYCWGSAASYQLGRDLGPTFESERPVRVPGVAHAVSLSANRDRTCVVVEDGSVWCWGTEELGAFGMGKTTAWKRATRIDGIDGAKEVALGMTHALVLMRDGTVRGWGLNNGAVLGELDMFQLHLAPEALPGVTNARRLATSASEACIVGADGGVRCWGKSPFGSKAPFVKSPKAVAGLSNAQDVGVGSGFGCALLADHTVRCWGDNDYGQLGAGHHKPVDSPVRARVSDVAKLRVHGSSACAINAGGALLCWGANGLRQLGTSGNPQETPYQLATIHDVTAVDVDARGCASTGAPGVFCWDDKRWGPTQVPW
jgi:alpha-tubulin suppressor-like RCC1 family protein